MNRIALFITWLSLTATVFANSNPTLEPIQKPQSLQNPTPSFEEVFKQPKTRMNECYYLGVGALPFLNNWAIGYRSLYKVHGWESSLNYQGFGGVYVDNFRFKRDKLSILYNATSLEFGYLPHYSFKNCCVYFGLGGGLGVGKRVFLEDLGAALLFSNGREPELSDHLTHIAEDEVKRVFYPTFYIKPGVALNTENPDELTHFIDLKIGYPFNASLNYGIGF